MSVQLQPNMTQNAHDLKICEDYWAYLNVGGYDNYIQHIDRLCQKYEISSEVLHETVAQCYAWLDDVCCEFCGTACHVEVPADIPYMRAKDSYFCAVCENALWR